jgi:hypothetical protein
MPGYVNFIFALAAVAFVLVCTDTASGNKLKSTSPKQTATPSGVAKIKGSNDPTCGQFSRDKAQTRTAIALAESGGNTGARNCK